ncbi:MAG: hypothetical protein ABSD85_13860 [Acidimicrobiales bacterium]|jgi:hypothetical protein
MTGTSYAALQSKVASDHRGSWVPTGGMIATRFMELRKRRGLMIALIAVNIGLPTVFLIVRLVAHAVAPRTYGPAGGYNIYSNLVAGVMYVFGFIIAATLGCTAGSVDLTEGMFRHLVVTGRSRLALYLARIPAGLAIVLPLVAIGFTIVCTVCVFAAPKAISYDGANIPARLSLPAFETWAGQHPDVAICDFPYAGNIAVNVPCGNGPGGSSGVKIVRGSPPPGAGRSSPAIVKAQAIQIARQDYEAYTTIFLYPSGTLMVETGLWLELEAIIGFIVGLGLASLLGQRTVSVILMFVLEIILTPLLSTARIAYMINFQRAIVGLATAHLEPSALPLPFGGGGGGPSGHAASQLVPESTVVAVCVILAWLVGWTALGAWRMMTRDA